MNEELANNNQVWVGKLLNRDQRAGGIIRLCAGFFDFIFVSLLLIITSAITTSWMIVQSESPSDNIEYIRRYMWENEFHLYLINWVIIFLVFLALHVIYTVKGRRSIGMRMVDLYVYNEHAEQPSAFQFFTREMLKYVLFPFFIMSFGKNKRTLYDIVTKTYLIK